MPLDPKDQKEILKEALHEWLDAKFAAFGKWTLMGMAAAAFSGLAYFALIGLGWHK